MVPQNHEFSVILENFIFPKLSCTFTLDVEKKSESKLFLDTSKTRKSRSRHYAILVFEVLNTPTFFLKPFSELHYMMYFSGGFHFGLKSVPRKNITPETNNNRNDSFQKRVQVT